MIVLGIQKDVNFVIDGREFSGISIYAGYEKYNVTGLATEKFFISTGKRCFDVANSLKVNDNINVGYNKYGKVEYLEII